MNIYLDLSTLCFKVNSRVIKQTDEFVVIRLSIHPINNQYFISYSHSTNNPCIIITVLKCLLNDAVSIATVAFDEKIISEMEQVVGR
jgi:hypothetical protein